MMHVSIPTPGKGWFHSCFISHSGSDVVFARKLRNDLQGRGVPCWFAPENLKSGEKMRRVIYDAIRRHDRLLVLISVDSVGSGWVEDEVEYALDMERRMGRTILMPIRLDGAVMETEVAWVVSIRNTRHIADFQNWGNPAIYDKAFNRLLRDLRIPMDKAAI